MVDSNNTIPNLKELLGHRRGHDSSSSRSRDQSHPDAAALASHLNTQDMRTRSLFKNNSHLARDGVGLSKLGSPETTSHGNDGELGHDDGAADGSGDLLAALHAEPDVAVVVADGHEGLEPSSLSSPGLLLDRHDLENLILQGRSKEEVNDLVLLDKRCENRSKTCTCNRAQYLEFNAKSGHRLTTQFFSEDRRVKNSSGRKIKD